MTRRALLTLLVCTAAAHAAPLCNVATPTVAPLRDLSAPLRLGAVDEPKAGAWIWINVWATWCHACVAELPRVQAWQEAQGGPAVISVLPLSVDADRDTVRAALASHGLRGSLWLPPGPARAGWLDARGFSTSLSLPMHALFDPQGRLRCLREGAVDATDLAAVRILMGRR